MSKSLLSEYGPESSSGSRASNGGKPQVKPLSYDPPKGPTPQMQQGPSLHGTNHGCCGTQGKH